MDTRFKLRQGKAQRAGGNIEYSRAGDTAGGRLKARDGRQETVDKETGGNVRKDRRHEAQDRRHEPFGEHETEDRRPAGMRREPLGHGT